MMATYTFGRLTIEMVQQHSMRVTNAPATSHKLHGWVKILLLSVQGTSNSGELKAQQFLHPSNHILRPAPCLLQAVYTEFSMAVIVSSMTSSNLLLHQLQ